MHYIDEQFLKYVQQSIQYLLYTIIMYTQVSCKEGSQNYDLSGAMYKYMYVMGIIFVVFM